jgi:Tfp pilus assembly major pilin PilA
MERSQKGITLMSFIVVLAVVGFFALIAMKLFPMYSEFNNLKSAVNELAAQPNSASMTIAQVQADLSRRFNIAYVESVNLKNDVKIIRGAGRTSQLQVAYEVRRPMFGNLDVVGKFEHTVNLTGTSSSE